MPDHFELPARARQWTGQTVGYLLVLRPLRRAPNRDIVWLCRCKCGNVIERRARQLHQARSRGQASRCIECSDARRQPRAEGVKSEFAMRFEQTGSLYSASEERAETSYLARCAGLSPGKVIARTYRDLLFAHVTAWPSSYR